VNDHAQERRGKDSYSEDLAKKQIPIQEGNYPAEESFPKGKIQDAWKTQERKDDYSHEDKLKAGLVIERTDYNAAAERYQKANPGYKLCLSDL